VDRYNHDLEAEDTEDDADDILFHSFSSCSPRYSKVYSKIEELQEVGLTCLKKHSNLLLLLCRKRTSIDSEVITKKSKKTKTIIECLMQFIQNLTPKMRQKC